MSDSKEIIAQLKSGDKTLLNTIYREYRGKFVGWAAKQFNANEEQAVEIFQDAVVTLYENVHSGKLKEITTTLQSYIFAIGRNKFLELTRYQKKNGNIEENTVIESADDDEDHEEKNAVFEQVGNALNKLGPPCKTLLQYFYYEKKNMDDIADIMEYKNSATAKNQKYKCLQRLKKIVFEENNRHE